MTKSGRNRVKSNNSRFKKGKLHFPKSRAYCITKYLPSAGVHGVVTEPVQTGTPLTIELVEDTEVADETEPDEELLSPF